MAYNDHSSDRVIAFPKETMQDPIAVFEKDQDEYLKLCMALEEIADALPGNVDFAKAEAAVFLLRDGFTSHVSSQEELLFPLLRRRARTDDAIEVLLAQVEYEHAVDQGLAVEVADMLADMIKQHRACNPNMLGYVLRCFFEGYRRHAAWETRVIYHICRNRLTSEDRIDLTLRLASVARFSFWPRVNNRPGQPESGV